ISKPRSKRSALSLKLLGGEYFSIVLKLSTQRKGPGFAPPSPGTTRTARASNPNKLLIFAPIRDGSLRAPRNRGNGKGIPLPGIRETDSPRDGERLPGRAG